MPENSRRSAHATIRGYLYQTCLGVQRWLDLQPDEFLVCEGDEDLDRHLLDGTVVSEQVKAYSNRLGLGDQAVLDSLFNFLRTYVALRREGTDRKFIFTTTAEPRKQRNRGLDFDLLEKWREGVRTRKIISAVQSLLNPKKKNTHLKEIMEARAWLDGQPEGWAGFMNAVEWTFDAPDLDSIRRTIQSRLAREERTRHLDADIFTDRLVVHVLDASSQPEINARTLTPATLAKLVQEDLNRWANSQRGRRIREAFDEAARIQDLLNTGTDKLRDLKPGTLLTAAHEVIPFDEAGRQKELDLLAGWCQEEEPRGVLLLTGEGGSGKTRLMIEWCRRLRHQGWHAGFLRRDRQAIELDPFLKGTAPRLVVVDYAETQMAVVKPLLQKLASAEHGVGPKVRVVLLARREGDWWRNLSEEDGEIARLPKRSDVISPLIPSDIEARQEAFHRAMDGFVVVQKDRSVTPNVPLPEFSDKDFERVLLIHMAALAALDETSIGTAAEALQATLVHERRFWKKQVADRRMSGDLAPLLERAVEIAVTAVTLVQGCPTEQETEALLARVLRHLPLQAHHTGMVRDLIRNLYDGSEGDNRHYLDPLQPDLLGEELVAEALTRDTGLIGRILEQGRPREVYYTLVVLSRLARRISQAEDWIRILAKELEEKGTQEVWVTLQQVCDEEDYHRSLPLREIACVATEERLKLLREQKNFSETEQAEYGRLLNNYGVRLNALGRFEEAMVATGEAVGIYRQLAQTAPDTFLPYLAHFLNNLGVRFQALGRPKESLQPTSEAIEIYRKLAAAKAESFTSNLATCLSSLSLAFSDLGRLREALQAAEEAVMSYREIPPNRFNEFLPGFALSLSNLGKVLLDLRNPGEALQVSAEATEIYKQLAQSRPDAFLPDLARTLNNMSSALSELGRPEDALQVNSEAVKINRQITRNGVGFLRPELVRSLNNQCKLLSELGRKKEALQACEEVVRISRQLAQIQPEALYPDFAKSLNNLGTFLSNLGRPEEALQANTEALGIYRELARAEPNLLQFDFAICLYNSGAILSLLGRQEDALLAIDQAIRTLSPLFLQIPSSFADWVAMMARYYLEKCEAIGHEPAETLLTPILEVFQVLSPDQP